MTAPQPGVPVITIAVSDALARIEAKIDGITVSMAQKADSAMVHDLETRVRVLETSQASQTAVTQALGRSKTSIWVAVGSLAGAASAVVYIVVTARGH